MAKHSIFHEFQFRPSQLATLIHLSSLIIITILSYSLLALLYWLIFIGSLLILLFIFKRQYTHIIYLGHLDQEQWTLKTRQRHQEKLQRIRIQRMLNHQLYIIIEYQILNQTQSKSQSLIIWYDQLDQTHWKALQSRVSLQHFNR
ncbi:MAG: hypothetical protein Q4D05_00505 [Acinetobacter sp.]|nr:hypothetical protein [Acinetobacter sp.]